MDLCATEAGQSSDPNSIFKDNKFSGNQDECKCNTAMYFGDHLSHYDPKSWRLDHGAASGYAFVAVARGKDAITAASTTANGVTTVSLASAKCGELRNLEELCWNFTGIFYRNFRPWRTPML
jgi:hypothetical protein